MSIQQQNERPRMPHDDGLSIPMFGFEPYLEEEQQQLPEEEQHDEEQTTNDQIQTD